MYIYIKRFLDFVFSFSLIILLFLPLVFVSLIIVLDNGFPIFFIDKRLGKNEIPFKLYKFRSMRTNTPINVASKDIDSKFYITTFGKFIRRFSIDELPQLFNVLNGTMSFVGPRPTILSEKELIQYRQNYNVFSIKPGLTGLAQVKGRDILALSASQKAKADKEYLHTISFLTDLKIIIKTILVVILGFGFKEGG